MDFDKSTVKYSPCKPPIDCSQYADDEYDPCEKTPDITDTDLSVLSKKEKEKKAGQGEQIKAEEQLKTGEKIKAEGQLKTGEKIKEGEQVTAGVKDTGKAVVHEGTSKGDAVGDFSPEEGEKSKTGNCKKKPNCRKVKRNPFFPNRLNFSSDLPPRPATPPTQFFPPVEDGNVKRCRKRKKKCIRRSGDGKYGDGKGIRGGQDGQDGQDGLGGQGRQGGQGGQGGQVGDEGGNKDLCVCPGVDMETCDPTTCLTSGSDEAGLYGDDKYRGRKCAPRRKIRPPCRKKDSETSIGFQPRKIPALQKDLPEKCPKEEAIKNRKLPLLCVVECLTRDCKKKSKKSF